MATTKGSQIVNGAGCKQSHSVDCEGVSVESVSLEQEQQKPSDCVEDDFSPQKWVSFINQAFLLCCEVL